MKKQFFQTLKNLQPWQKLAFVVGFTGIVMMSASPVLARYRLAYRLFQPYAGASVPYRGTDNLIDALSKEKKFSNLVYELKEAGLLEKLKQEKDFTIFAPTDAAFNALSRETFNRYRQPENRSRILNYHIVVGNVTEDDMNKGGKTTSEGSAVKIQVNPADESVKINGANTKYPSIQTKNGVIIEVDQVLTPPGF
ncbi:fasciclin domain-containing protein [Calothrix sp. 336/3]|uniref:fasciclin domain-containing protein n=1 Tax=Calothrix sp. 336/3 TaxID=1337936 RepID=UPI0004E2E4A8|nr:fasciclin domain-containing protein [Calothrix sp. 336/3]AKG22938.1 beta-Ig-H3/fasciclin [Calothrix sp. 336/3]